MPLHTSAPKAADRPSDSLARGAVAAVDSTPKSGAAHHRGESRQDFGTPPEFIAAVQVRFGFLAVDLAASAENTKALRYVTAEQDSLSSTVPWEQFAGERCWLNPPFADIAPWAKKASLAKLDGGTIFLLVPASVGANWYAEHVHGKALVLLLNGRLKFDGKNGYPKDCVLACYSTRLPPGYEVWRWPDEVKGGGR